MVSLIIKILNEIKNFFAKIKINSLGKQSKAYCWVFKRNKSSIINIGNNSLINGRLVTESKNSKIEIGNNVFVGGQTIFDCLQEIKISDNVLISYECILSDHDSHSIESKKREMDLYKFQNKKMNWEEVNSKPIFIKKKCLDWNAFDNIKRCNCWRRIYSCCRKCSDQKCSRLHFSCW